jgi:DNA primase
MKAPEKNDPKTDRLSGTKTLKVSGFLDEFEKDEIKTKVDIIRLFEGFGVKLSRKGKNHIGLCPWHDDHNPSLSVDREKGLYNCFGCGESGDAFDLVMKMKGCGFKEALIYLKSVVGNRKPQADGGNGYRKTAPEPAPEAEARPPEKPAPIKILPADLSPIPEKAPVTVAPYKPEAAAGEPKAEETNSTAGLNQKPSPATPSFTDLSEYFHKRLYSNPEALAYLKGRGFDKPELYQRFRIGFADGTLLDKLSKHQIEALKEQGIITENGREHFLGCIVSPFSMTMTGRRAFTAVR